jgi:hypothetical protein
VRTRVSRLLLLAAGALTLTLALGVGVAGAHPHLTAPPVDLTLSVRGTDVLGVLVVDKWLVATWGMPPNHRPDLKQDLPLDDLVRRLETRFEVRLDGTHVVPHLSKVTEPSKVAPSDAAGASLMVPTLRIVLAYPVASVPKQIAVRWKDFSGIFWEGKVEAALQIEAQGNVDTKELTPLEPEFLWHMRPPPAFRAPLPPLPSPPAPRRLPLLPLAVGLVALALPFLPWARRQDPRRRWLPASGLMLLAALGARLGVGSVEPGGVGGSAAAVTDAQARQIARTLLTNVYRAFDAQGEQAIYDLLAASVERGLLEGLYADVYESLVLREQGGAVCRVAEVTFDEGVVALVAGVPTLFQVEQPWKVRGTVSHWGHTHERQTLYRARLSLHHAEGAWRIAGIEMLEHKRIDDGVGGSTEPAR